jgi:hypothetical protein
MATIAPGRLHDVSNAADFVALTETNFEILIRPAPWAGRAERRGCGTPLCGAAEVFKQEPIPQARDQRRADGDRWTTHDRVACAE